METPIEHKHPTFHPKRRTSNFFRAILWIALILLGVWYLLGLQRGQIRSPLKPTPTSTRTAASFFMEAEAYFNAGRLDDPSNNQEGSQGPAINDAIEAYQAALTQDPKNAQAWAELARIQAYSSSMLSNDTQRLKRLEEAVESSKKAVELAPDDSTAHAIRAFTLDWYAYNPLISSKRTQELLVEAEREASRAFQLDPQNALALAYYAEILNDQSKWAQAEKYALQAVTQAPDLMDTHRVYAYTLETLGKYNSAIQQYQKAADITPNFTYLYLRIGQNFREGIKNTDRALEYFDRAAKINEQLGVKNPQPYLEIAKTYIQQGQFFVAMINSQKALDFDNTNANTYGQLGIINMRARNYEGAVPLLRCAVKGCTAEENEMGGVAVEGLPLSNTTVAYYYVELGTVLAFMSRETENYCSEAREVLNQVRAGFSDDPVLISIVEDSEGICRRLESGSITAPTPTSGTTTPDEPTETPEPTPSMELSPDSPLYTPLP